MECFLVFAVFTMLIIIISLISNSHGPILPALAESLIIAPGIVIALAMFTYTGTEWNIDCASTYAFLQSIILCGVCLKHLTRSSKGDSQ